MALNRKLAAAGLVLGSATIALAQSATIQPGQWEMISTTKSVEMPNAPPQVAQMMVGRSSTLRRCITSQEAAANGLREMVKANKSCTLGHFAMTGGKYDAEMTCSQGGGTMTAVTTGNYTPTTMNSTSRIIIKGPAPMTMTTSVAGKRVGAC